MILVVDGAHLAASTVAARVDVGEVDIATSVAEARERLEVSEPTAVVVGGPPSDDAGALLEDLRAGRVGRPWVGVLAVTAGGGSDAVDATVPPGTDGETLAAAIEQTDLLGRYRQAIHSFFDTCRDAPETGAGEPDLRAARREADAWLEAIQDREGPLPLDRLLADR